MGFTKIKNVTNMTSRWMWLQNGENLKFGLVMPPLARSILLSSTDMNVPWCDSHDRANDGHSWKWNDADGRPQKSFVMWQHDRWWKDNDRVRFSGDVWRDEDNNWMSGGEKVDGERSFYINSDTYPAPKAPPGDRSLALSPRVGLGGEGVRSEMTPISLDGPQSELDAANAIPGQLPADFKVPNDSSGMTNIAWWPIGQRAEPRSPSE